MNRREWNQTVREATERNAAAAAEVAHLSAEQLAALHAAVLTVIREAIEDERRRNETAEAAD